MNTAQRDRADNRRALLTGASALGLILSVPAAAQPADSVASGYVDRDEIVVTAQRRSELARDVPLSITAQSGEQLTRAGVTDSRDLTSLTPGLKMDRVGGFSTPAIRGVSTQLTQAGNEANVAIYLDGVYQPAQVTGTFDLPDVERVEILKGPQGTLFGRNATGGAIQVFTLNPSYTPTGRFSASYGNFDEVVLKGFASAPIVAEKAAASISGYYRRADGYNRDLLRGGDNLGRDESWVIRGKLHLDPAEWLSVTGSAYVSQREDASATPGIPLNGNTVDRFSPDAVIPTRPYDAANNVTGDKVKQHGFSLRGEADLGFATLTSISGYSKSTTLISIDATFGFTPSSRGVQYIAHDTTRAFSQELSLSSNGNDLIGYTLGLYYYDAYGYFDPLRVVVDVPVAPPALDLAIYGRQDSEAYAAFGEIFVKPIDRLSLIAGIRYSREKRVYTGAVVPFGFPTPDLDFKNRRTFDGVTPRFSVLYEVVDDTNLYFTYSQGFKSGGFNTTDTAPDGGPSVSPEKIQAYEVGVKSRAASWLDFNVAGFFYNYKDIQVNAYQTVDGVPISILQNAASAHIKGLDAEAILRPVEGLRLQAGLSILDATFEDFPGGAVVVPNTHDGTPTGIPIGGNHSEARANLKGNRLIRSPDWTLNLSANYSTPFAGGMLELNGQLYHSDKFFFDSGNRVAQPAYTTMGGRIAWSPDETGLTFSVYGKNLTNKAVLQGTFITELADGVSYAPPRTYGVVVDFKF